MKTLHTFFIIRWLDKLLRLEQAEQEVSNIKKEAIDQIDSTQKTLKKAGALQKRVMDRTTTSYYIAKAAGVLR